jgi:hypothetical protein
MPFIRPVPLEVFPVAASVLVGNKEGEGTAVNSITASLGVSSANLTLITIDAILTSSRSGAPTLNNGNSFGALLIDEVYSPNFNQYGLQVRALNNCLGGSNHSSVLNKSVTTNEECTRIFLAITGGSSVVATSVVRNAAGANTAMTSANYTVASGSSARVLAFTSGTGFSLDATVQTITMLESGWELLHAYEFSGVTAAAGHIPMRLWSRIRSPGTYSYQVQANNNGTGFDEGAIIGTLVIQ